GQRLVEGLLLAVSIRQVVLAVGDPGLHAGAVERSGRDLPGGDGFGVTAAEMTDDPEIVGRAARGGMIAVSARRHQGLGYEFGRCGEVGADEGDGAARVERMTLDAMLAELARPAQGAIDPLQALFVAAEPRLRNAVEQREGRILELTLLARAQELDDRGMM